MLACSRGVAFRAPKQVFSKPVFPSPQLRSFSSSLTWLQQVKTTASAQQPRSTAASFPYKRACENTFVTSARIFGTYVPKRHPKSTPPPPRSASHWLKKHVLDPTYLDFYRPAWKELKRRNPLQPMSAEWLYKQEQLKNMRARGKEPTRKGMGKRAVKKKRK